MKLTFEVAVYITKQEPIYLTETSLLPYWVAIIAIQRRVKKKYFKLTGCRGINVIVKRHENDI